MNPKRRMGEPGMSTIPAARVAYLGSPLHKRSPGDYGLTPPADPRPNKTLCDEIGIFERAKAQALLQQGLERGTISPCPQGELPRYIWAVTDDGRVVEARCDDATHGTYHGYPLADADPMANEVKKRWVASS